MKELTLYSFSFVYPIEYIWGSDEIQIMHYTEEDAFQIAEEICKIHNPSNYNDVVIDCIEREPVKAGVVLKNGEVVKGFML